MQWNLMCDAPKDGTVIDVWVWAPGKPGYRIHSVRWVDPTAGAGPEENTRCFMVGWKTASDDQFGCLVDTHFTHFMVVTGPDEV